MKKKHRDIVVDNITYGWIVDAMGYELRIFKDKKVVLNVRVEEFTPVTPKIIEGLIREYILKQKQ